MPLGLAMMFMPTVVGGGGMTGQPIGLLLALTYAS
jgi:hypothetical protein